MMGNVIMSNSLDLLLQAISMFINRHWDDLQRFIELHPEELLGNEADNALDILIDSTDKNNKEEVEAQHAFSELRKILHHSKEIGVKKACAEYEFEYITWKIFQLIKPGEMSDRAELCRRALKILDLLAYDQNKRSAFWAQLQFELGESLSQIPSINSLDNIEDAIEAYHQALTVVTPESDKIFWSGIMVSLGIAYRNRIAGDKAENLELAIWAYKSALEAIDRKKLPEEWGKIKTNLGNVYRIRVKGDPAQNIEDSIDAHIQALEVLKPETLNWGIAQMNLGNAHRNRQYGIENDNINKAIQSYLLALKAPMKESMPIEWAKTWLNLGIAYGDYQSDHRAEYLDKAIQACDYSLEILTREEYPILWCIAKVNLSAAYLERSVEYNINDRAEAIEKSIDASNAALEELTLESAPDTWANAKLNLGTAYRFRLIGNKADNFRNAEKAYLDALKVFNAEIWPDKCRNAARSLGDLLFSNENWEEAIDAYQTAINAAEKLYEESLLRMGKEKELARTSDLCHLAAYAAAQLNHATDAVVFIELGRARWLNEALERDRLDLMKLKTENSEAFEKYQDASMRARKLEERERMFRQGTDNNPPYKELSSISKEAQLCRAEMDDAKANIRLIPGYENFLMLPKWENIEGIAKNAENLPIVYLSTTFAGSFALIVHASRNIAANVQTIWLNKFKRNDLSKLLRDWFTEYKKIEYDFPAWCSAIDRILEFLWDQVMGHVVITLQEMGVKQAVIVPTGLLGLLPLHAAWTSEGDKRRYALDSIAFSYAPSARSLHYSKRIATTIQPKNLLALEGPNLNKDSQKEIDIISPIFGVEHALILKHDMTSLPEIMDALTKNEVVHFLCHGKYNWDDPRKSSLRLLKGETLTMDDFLGLNIQGARMATLSACETGIPDRTLPDEVISLPSALLKAGFAGVVASLWSVSQKSTSELMGRFYHIWLKDGKEPSIALRDAQILVRDEFRDSKHPFFWAAFYLSGI
jgi:hypothetical protein